MGTLPTSALSPSGPSTSAESYLHVSGISVNYGRIVALRPLSFDLVHGGLLLVLGPNGAGKTTLLHALAGMLVPRTGRVALDGRDVTFLPAFRRVTAGIALVPEGRGVLPGLTVRENLELGQLGAPRATRHARTQEWDKVIAMFPILGERLNQDSRSLSGGEMQMLAIGRALLARPKVLLLDEPSLGLAPRIVARVYRALQRLNDDGLTMVVVEQKAVPVQQSATRVLVMQNGRVVYGGEGGQLSTEQLARLYLGGDESAERERGEEAHEQPH